MSWSYSPSGYRPSVSCAHARKNTQAHTDAKALHKTG